MHRPCLHGNPWDRSFRGGDAPYGVRVSYRGRHTDVMVLSYCGCGGSDAAIDLSPSAFAELAELSRGRIDVIVEGPIDLPRTDTEGETR